MLQRRTILKTGAAAALAAPALTGFAQPAIKLKFHTFLPHTSSTWKKLLRPWMDKVAEDSGGRIRFEAYPSMQLGGAPSELLEQLKEGVVDLIWTLPGYTPGRFPRLEVFELPFMMTDAGATSRALWSYAQSTASQEFKGIQPLALHVHGPGLLHMRQKPVRTTEDLNGLKLRAPTRQVSKLLRLLGAHPVGMPLNRVPDALSKGQLDGCTMPWEAVYTTRIHQWAPHHSEFDPRSGALYTTVQMLAMNPARFNALPPELKYVFELNSGANVSAEMGETMQSGDAAGRQLALDSGDELLTISQLGAQAFRRKARRVEEEWVQEMTQQGLGGEQLVDKARQLITRHTLHL